MKKYLSIVVLILFNLNVFAQGEMFGSSSSNYAGVNSVLLNPSAMHNQNVWLSFNSLSGNMFLHTDYMYISKDDFQFGDLVKEWINYSKGEPFDYEIPMHETGYGVEVRPFYSFDSKKNTSLDQSIRIQGPSVMLAYNQHAFALTSSARWQSNIRNINPDLANLMAYGFPYFEPFEDMDEFQVDDFNAVTMAWSEIGFSYAYQMNKQSFGGWSFGVSIKRLLGAGGAYLDVDHSTYSLVNNNEVDVTDQQAEIGFSAPYDYDTNEFIDFNLLNGRGWAFDLGFTYQSLLKRSSKFKADKFCEQPIIDYKYRIGVALLDIGSISFDQNAQTHNFNTYSGGDGLGNFNGVVLYDVNHVLRTMSEHFYQDTTASLVDNSMRIALPMALSTQFDYNTEIDHLYLNVSLIYGIPIQGGALRRPSQLTIAPRYETNFVEFSVPLSFYQFQYPHLGVFARVGPVGIGSDWFSTLLGNQDFNGMDFYFSVKFQLKKDNCRTKKSIRDACGDKSGRFHWAYN